MHDANLLHIRCQIPAEFRATAIHALHQDPAETSDELARVLQAGAIILGSSKGAAAFVLGELTWKQGSTMQIYAEHRYLPGRKLQHMLRLADAAVYRSGLADNWGKTIAVSLGSELPLARVGDKQVIITTTGRHATSPGYLGHEVCNKCINGA